MEPGNQGGDRQDGPADGTVGMSVSGSVPLHRQIATQIRRQIDGKELPIHSKLASEVLLAQQYGVSRGTITKALDSLVQQRVLYRRRPQGTFVAGPPSVVGPLEVASEIAETPSSALPT